jgi:hypothetical protein
MVNLKGINHDRKPTVPCYRPSGTETLAVKAISDQRNCLTSRRRLRLFRFIHPPAPPLRSRRIFRQEANGGEGRPMSSSNRHAITSEAARSKNRAAGGRNWADCLGIRQTGQHRLCGNSVAGNVIRQTSHEANNSHLCGDIVTHAGYSQPNHVG